MSWVDIIELGFITFIIAYLAIGANKTDTGWIWSTHVKTSERLEKLEKEVRYQADQPPHYFNTSYDIQSWQALHGRNWEEEMRKNDVPINDVVKAIVKHLGMEILKVPESTIKNPQEVKVVEKPKVVMGATGVVTMPDGSGMPMPKAKRKYTKRKTK